MDKKVWIVIAAIVAVFGAVITISIIQKNEDKMIAVNADDYNCMAVVSSQTYNSNGVMFEYTQSRHRPDYFRFYDNAVRKPV